LEIPTVDPGQSATFNGNVFGWNVRHRDTPRPSFDDATGNVSGAWSPAVKSAASLHCCPTSGSTISTPRSPR
jgi:predicted enzyme related to lactoylglutathione lyase